eukprot:Em0014g187a
MHTQPSSPHLLSLLLYFLTSLARAARCPWRYDSDKACELSAVDDLRTFAGLEYHFYGNMELTGFVRPLSTKQAPTSKSSMMPNQTYFARTAGEPAMSRRPRVNDRGGKGKGKPTEEEAGRDFSVSVEGEGGSVGTGRSDGKRSRGGRQRGRGRGRGGRGRNGESHSTEHEQAERASLVEQGGNRRGGRRQRPSRGRGKSNFVPELKWKLVGLGPSDVHDLAGLSVVEEIVERVGKDIKAFVHTINNIVLPRGAKLMKDVLKIISMLASSLSVQTLDAEDTTRDEACVVLGEVLSDRCAPFHMQLHHFIVEGPERHVMQQLCNTFRTLLESLPESSWGCLPVDVLKDTIERSECDTDSVLRQSICEVAELKDNITEQRRLKNENKATKGNCEITWDNSEYREIPLLPTWGEVCINKVPAKLRPNIIKGEYENWMHYYDVHFRLLREDFIAPLRRGICDYLDGMNGRQLRDVKVYSSVKVLEPQFTYAGVSYRVHFDTSRLKRYRWEHSKRLLFGSLLCLSPDDFRNVVLFATVSDRKPEELKKGFVSLQFEEGADLQYIFDPKAVFVMVESNAFFEASRHVLRSLQTAEVETMPFTRYIIKCDSKSVNAPKYLDATNCSYNLSCLYGSTESSKQPLMINILDRQQWPVARRVELDQSQLDAIQQALTQEVAIIQGPPGTGKTYIGLKIVEALLRNRKVWDSCGQSPILVMCYTNHALDQFLQGILSIRLPEEVNEDEDEDDLIKRLRKASIEPLKSVVPTIVRVGGRCQNEAINEFNVEKLVRKVYIPSEIRQKYNRCRDKLNMFHHAADMKALKTFFEPNNHSFLKLSELSELVDDPDLVYQLSQLARTEDDHGYEVELWLGLWDQVELTATKDGRIFSENIIDPTYHVIKKYNKTEDTQPELNSYDNDADDDEVSFLQNSGLGTGDMMSSGTAASKNDGHINDEKDAVESNMDELIDVQGEAEIEESSRVLTEDIEDYQPVDFEKAAENVHTLCTVMNLPEEKVDLLAYGDETISSNDGNDGNAVKATDDDIQGSLTAQEDDDDAQVIEDAENTDDEVQDDLITDMKDIRAEMYQKTIVWRPKVDAGKNITKYLSKTTMSQSQAKAVKNIFALEPQQKWQLYNYWVMKKYQNMHLILIGDHKQLRPKPNEYELVKKYNLDISLFERLVQHQLPHATLNIQHRMRPEIAQLVHPHIYEVLHNHESVLKYDHVKGVFRNMFFIDHEYPEESEDNLMSHANQHEAEFTVALCKYLLQQGYDGSQITILTPYTGQLLKLKALMPKAVFFGVRATAVDNFQGEENDIILLSLVRSNKEGQLGFLKEPNRFPHDAMVLMTPAAWTTLLVVHTAQSASSAQSLSRCALNPVPGCVLITTVIRNAVSYVIDLVAMSVVVNYSIVDIVVMAFVRLCLENVRRIAEDIMREDVQCMYTLLDEVLSSKPIPMTHNMAIVEAIENYKENLLGVGKDEAQLMHLLLQANNVIEYAERNSISVNLKQFAATCSTLKELARTTNSLKYQMSQQLIDDFSSELYKILLQTHCIQAKTQLTFKRSESSAVKLAKMHITPVEDTLDALDNKRLLEGVFKKHRETLQKIYPIDVVISHSKVFSTRCHWYKCPKGHGYYSAGPKVENATCPLCDSK